MVNQKNKQTFQLSEFAGDPYPLYESYLEGPQELR